MCVLGWKQPALAILHQRQTGSQSSNQSITIGIQFDRNDVIINYACCTLPFGRLQRTATAALVASANRPVSVVVVVYEQMDRVRLAVTALDVYNIYAMNMFCRVTGRPCQQYTDTHITHATRCGDQASTRLDGKIFGHR